MVIYYEREAYNLSSLEITFVVKNLRCISIIMSWVIELVVGLPKCITDITKRMPFSGLLHFVCSLTLIKRAGIMSFVRPQQPRGGKFHRDNRSSCARNSNMAVRATGAAPPNYHGNFGTHDYNNYHDFTQTYRLDGLMYDRRGPDFAPSPKRRKTSAFSAENTGFIYQQQQTYQYDLANRADSFKPSRYYNACADAQLVCKSSSAVAETRSGGANPNASSASKCDPLKFEDEEVVFMSRDDIEKSSPSRKDGIDQLHETYLRYSYCSFLQDIGVRLHL